jgi:hypothetical protein
MDAYAAINEKRRDESEYKTSVRKKMVGHMTRMSQLVCDLLRGTKTLIHQWQRQIDALVPTREKSDELDGMQHREAKQRRRASADMGGKSKQLEAMEKHLKDNHELAINLCCVVLGMDYETVYSKWDQDGDGDLDSAEILMGMDMLLETIENLTEQYDLLIVEDSLLAEIVRDWAQLIFRDWFPWLGLKGYVEERNKRFIGTKEMETIIKTFSNLDIFEADGTFDDDGVVDKKEWAAAFKVLPSIREKYSAKEWAAKYDELLLVDDNGELSRTEFDEIVQNENLNGGITDKAKAAKKQQAEKAALSIGGGRLKGKMDQGTAAVLSWDKVLTMQGYQRAVMIILRYGQLLDAEDIPMQDAQDGVATGSPDYVATLPTVREEDDEVSEDDHTNLKVVNGTPVGRVEKGVEENTDELIELDELDEEDTTPGSGKDDETLPATLTNVPVKPKSRSLLRSRSPDRSKSPRGRSALRSFSPYRSKSPGRSKSPSPGDYPLVLPDETADLRMEIRDLKKSQARMEQMISSLLRLTNVSQIHAAKSVVNPMGPDVEQPNPDQPGGVVYHPPSTREGVESRPAQAYL